MNKQQNVSNAGKLFDVNGNSSVGNLPRGRLIVKEQYFPTVKLPSYTNAASPAFTVGSLPGQNSVAPTSAAAANVSPFVEPVSSNGQGFLHQGMQNPV